MVKFVKDNITVIIISAVFFIVSFMTLHDYGISWDEPIHFTRGQAYLNYFLNGETEYKDFSGRHSIYQETSFAAKFFLKNDSGHPPINGILAASSNYIFYQKLGILGDIESYHLFNILSATFLVFIVSLFAKQAYGNLAAVFAGVSLILYPLFFAESHFNIKDPAEAAFYAATIWAFWNSLKKYEWRWLLAAAIFFALALGTKFNILFLPLIILPWLILRDRRILNPLRVISKLPRKFLIMLFAAPVIITVIFFLSWPYLWQDPINILNIFLYYKEIGTGGLGQPQYITWGGFNIFPAVWILTTTPPIILFLTALGIIAAFRRRETEKTALLFLLWMLIPVLRVSLPGSSIYGGVRQIMEFIPAMALLSGLGAVFLINLLRKFPVFSKSQNLILPIFIAILFVPHLLIMIKLHPNENVYFNSLIGGLSGAQKANIPYWGNSFGNAYYQAVGWINQNVQPGSKVGLIQGTRVNIPSSYFSPEINFSNSSWSGINRWGEYLVELTHQGNEIAYPFAWEYINKVLIPVYEVKVDGVPIAKVWKNDIENSRAEYREEKDILVESVKQSGNFLTIALPKDSTVARIIVEFGSASNCLDLNSGMIGTSSDGVNWMTEPEKLTDQQIVSYPTLEKGKIQYIFPARQAKFIKIVTDNEKSCLFQNPKVVVRGFKV
ncbi:hypothetical protein A3A14_01015 [Candidatus Daviesbacteria bacterium RIFCSPLOWO2_01_FULL_43_38]|uniref:Glycosyltransferase RgtA/B/C/D-like domain-containing protein n=1 Tax=Candidatus Daviesbacteria bacterium RIFCSPHIGHO2_12_FULL_43_11 TaxID=1797780 RepID=A0A1F5K764_9BACT|nr:MAG: hypothetical protein A3E45_01095 [Candidatus Daviesbacteria bacterium RIFCSPHIGHO2_12_FULL_43_11]OGE63546.1 MAG: hypothetical protein A3A14_01015 [Candidatus Daviesbacteria bacterium RIFCSPLOWO2_01_FULL_43_38]